MRLSELKSLVSSPYSRYIECTPVWNAPAESMNNAKLKALFELVRLKSDRVTARKAVKAVIQACARADFFGEIQLKEPLTFSDAQPLTLDEFTDHLNALDATHKRIFLLALSLKVSLIDAASYNWTMARSALRRKDLHPVARQILSSQIRCLTLDYIFYENVNGRLQPVYDADTHIESVIGSTWEIYEKRYASLVDAPV